MVRGRKLVGSAQVREGGAFLQHGSILLDDGQNVVADVTRGTGAAPQATSISAVLGRSVAFEEVADAVASEARRVWDGAWQRSELEPRPEEVELFEDPEWTWRR